MNRKTSAAMLPLIMLLVIFIAALIIGLLSGRGNKTENGEPLTDSNSSQDTSPESIHPSFDLSSEALTELAVAALSGLPVPEADRENIIAAIERYPGTFLEYLNTMLAENDQMLFALVDKEHLLPAGYVPPDLQSLNEYRELTLNRQDLSLRSRIMPDVLAMVSAAAEEGIVLDISSSYRSYAYQEQLFQRHVDQLGLKEAERVSARAGSSQHQLGSTVDFGSVTPDFARHPAGIWLAQEAWRFGFSLSYPDGYEEITGYSYEPWHFRYLGKEELYLQQVFFADIQQYMLLFYDLAHPVLQAARKASSE